MGCRGCFKGLMGLKILRGLRSLMGIMRLMGLKRLQCLMALMGLRCLGASVALWSLGDSGVGGPYGLYELLGSWKLVAFWAI